MSKMAYISYLVEHGDLKELAEELGSYSLAKKFIDESTPPVVSIFKKDKGILDGEPTTADEYNEKWIKEDKKKKT